MNDALAFNTWWGGAALVVFAFLNFTVSYFIAARLIKGKDKLSDKDQYFMTISLGFMLTILLCLGMWIGYFSTYIKGVAANAMGRMANYAGY